MTGEPDLAQQLKEYARQGVDADAIKVLSWMAEGVHPARAFERHPKANVVPPRPNPTRPRARLCLRCGKLFSSEHSGRRLCRPCRRAAAKRRSALFA